MAKEANCILGCIGKSTGSRLSEGLRGNGYKQKHREFHLNIRKVFTVRVTGEHWDRLLREVVESHSLEMLKTH